MTRDKTSWQAGWDASQMCNDIADASHALVEAFNALERFKNGLPQQNDPDISFDDSTLRNVAESAVLALTSIRDKVCAAELLFRQICEERQ